MVVDGGWAGGVDQAGSWTHQKGGFYHDGRFPTLLAVVQHYNEVFRLGLTPAEENDFVQYLLSI
jgi:hypothetical protein